MQNLEHSDGSEKDLGQKTTAAMVQSQHDCMVVQSKHSRVYSEYQLDNGAGAFKRASVTHRKAVTTAVKRTSRTSEWDGRKRGERLEEELERNVTLCLHNSFCRNRETNVDPIPCCKQRIERKKCRRTASNSVRIPNDMLQVTEAESSESMSQKEEMKH